MSAMGGKRTLVIQFGRRGKWRFLKLPSTCSLTLPDERFRLGASALRGHPELLGEMRWHFAAAASYVENIKNLPESHGTLKHASITFEASRSRGINA